MNFDEALVRAMAGSLGVAFFVKRILEHLHIDDRYPFARSCKWIYNIAVECDLLCPKRVALSRAVSEMRLERIQFYYDERLLYIDEMDTERSTELRDELPALAQWLVSTHLVDPEKVFVELGIEEDSIPTIQLAFKKNWDQGYWLKDLPDNLAVLELLYTRKPLWERFDLEVCTLTEDIFRFLLNHQDDPILSVKDTMSSESFANDAIFRANYFETIYMIRRLLAIYWTHHQRIKNCSRLTDAVRKEIHSSRCACNNPERHESLLFFHSLKRRKL